MKSAIRECRVIRSSGEMFFRFSPNIRKDRLKQEFERAFQTGKIERIEQQTTDDNGATKHWMVSKIPMRDETTNEITHVITVGEDVTMRVEAIHAVGRAEKLAAVGTTCRRCRSRNQ